MAFGFTFSAFFRRESSADVESGKTCKREKNNAAIQIFLLVIRLSSCEWIHCLQREINEQFESNEKIFQALINDRKVSLPLCFSLHVKNLAQNFFFRIHSCKIEIIHEFYTWFNVLTIKWWVACWNIANRSVVWAVSHCWKLSCFFFNYIEEKILFNYLNFWNISNKKIDDDYDFELLCAILCVF